MKTVTRFKLIMSDAATGLFFADQRPVPSVWIGLIAAWLSVTCEEDTEPD